MSPQSIYKIYGISVHLFHGRLIHINWTLQSSNYFSPIKGIVGHNRLLFELGAILNIIPMAFHYNYSNKGFPSLHRTHQLHPLTLRGRNSSAYHQFFVSIRCLCYILKLQLVLVL